MRERVTLGFAALLGYGFVASGERNGLEREERDFLRIVESELDDVPDLLVVDAVNDGDNRDDIDAVAPQVFDGSELYVEEVADGAVRVGGIADTVELQVGVAQTGFGGFFTKIRALGEFDTVGRSLDAVVADFAGVADGI